MDKLDQKFKDAMGQRSEPYDPQAWDALSKRLDGTLPNSGNPYLKWGLPSAIIVIGIAIGSWYMSSNNTVKNSETAKSEKSEQSSRTSPVVNPVNHTPNKEKQATITFDEDKSGTTQTPEFAEIQTENNKEIPLIPVKADEKVNKTKITEDPIQANNSEAMASFTAVKLPTCENAKYRIENTNSFEIVVRNSKNSVNIAANSSGILKFTAGEYEIVDAKSGLLLQSHTITTPKAEITADEVVYENGVPVQQLHVKTEATIQKASFGTLSLSVGSKDFSINPFKQGNQDLSIELIDHNGCLSSINQINYVADEYNLLAVNAFEPNSADSRKATFMPYALTQRGTPFRLIILDPSDGGLVFESTDANQAWDGIDKRYGRMADANKAFVWKVSLSKPLPGEKSEYMGTIVRM